MPMAAFNLPAKNSQCTKGHSETPLEGKWPAIRVMIAKRLPSAFLMPLGMVMDEKCK